MRYISRFKQSCQFREMESPAWHVKELLETEERLAQGKEQVLDWETAKKKLRKRFE
jgi:hypothetical protein